MKQLKISADLTCCLCGQKPIPQAFPIMPVLTRTEVVNVKITARYLCQYGCVNFDKGLNVDYNFCDMEVFLTDSETNIIHNEPITEEILDALHEYLENPELVKYIKANMFDRKLDTFTKANPTHRSLSE